MDQPRVNEDRCKSNNLNSASVELISLASLSLLWLERRLWGINILTSRYTQNQPLAPSPSAQPLQSKKGTPYLPLPCSQNNIFNPVFRYTYFLVGWGIITELNQKPLSGHSFCFRSSTYSFITCPFSFEYEVVSCCLLGWITPQK